MSAPREHLRDGRGRAASGSFEREIGAVAGNLGAAIRAERDRRKLTLRALAALTGLSRSVISGIEQGRVASLESYLRLGRALGLRAQFEFVDKRATSQRSRDPVHAAMGEFEARHFSHFGLDVRLDEPYQHYQFAGRADFLAWSIETRSLLHIENKTRLPDLQDVFGAFNAKRTYLGGEFAARLGLDGWRSETHVIAGLWSTEVLSVIRRHRASFEAVSGSSGAKALEAFATWWSGRPAELGARSVVVLLDPLARRSDADPWIAMQSALERRARYPGYSKAAAIICRIESAD